MIFVAPVPDGKDKFAFRMKLLTNILLLLALGAAGCTSPNDSQVAGRVTTEQAPQQPVSQPRTTSEAPPATPALQQPADHPPSVDLTFNGSRVGQFRIGARLPASAEPFSLARKTETISGEEGETLEVVTVTASLNGVPYLQLLPEPGYEGGQPGNSISQILILSDRYKTPEGFGVGTKLDEFTYNYPQFKLYYSYVSERYWAETGIDPMQFNLDPADYTQEIKITSDMMDLDPNDFKLSTRIQSIRVY